MRLFSILFTICSKSEMQVLQFKSTKLKPKSHRLLISSGLQRLTIQSCLNTAQFNPGPGHTAKIRNETNHNKRKQLLFWAIFHFVPEIHSYSRAVLFYCLCESGILLLPFPSWRIFTLLWSRYPGSFSPLFPIFSHVVFPCLPARFFSAA